MTGSEPRLTEECGICSCSSSENEGKLRCQGEKKAVKYLHI